ncbi:MAG: DUF4411 family protein [Dehalococcoidia bacterium]
MADYWLDSNIFISSKNGPYGFDIAPGFWTFIEAEAHNGTISSTTLVYQELTYDNDDELSTWVKQRRNLLFLEPDEAVQTTFSRIADYVKHRYDEANAAKFLGGADPWVIAHAGTHGGTVVTMEARVPSNSLKVKIPNVCDQFRVPSVGLYDMLRNLRASFG